MTVLQCAKGLGGPWGYSFLLYKPLFAQALSTVDSHSHYSSCQCDFLSCLPRVDKYYHVSGVSGPCNIHELYYSMPKALLNYTCTTSGDAKEL
jgi:hypothetical protein